MSLSSLPSPRQQKEETRLRAQVSASRAWGAAGSPPDMGRALPLSPSQIPAGPGSSCWWLQSPRGGNGTQQDPGVPASKAARALLLKAPFYPTPCSHRPTKSSQEITSVQCSWREIGLPGAVERCYPGPQGWGWEVPCPLLKGTHCPLLPAAATALHPSARRRKRRLERNTDATGKMDSRAGWGQWGLLGTAGLVGVSRADWGQ